MSYGPPVPGHRGDYQRVSRTGRVERYLAPLEFRHWLPPIFIFRMQPPRSQTPGVNERSRFPAPGGRVTLMVRTLALGTLRRPQWRVFASRPRWSAAASPTRLPANVFSERSETPGIFTTPPTKPTTSSNPTHSRLRRAGQTFATKLKKDMPGSRTIYACLHSALTAGADKTD